jgi:hypothetical protein
MESTWSLWGSVKYTDVGIHYNIQLSALCLMIPIASER